MMKYLSDYLPVVSAAEAGGYDLVKVTACDFSQLPVVLTGVKATAYDAGLGTWTFGETPIALTSSETPPEVGKVYAAVGTALIGEPLAEMPPATPTITVSGTHQAICSDYAIVDATATGTARVYHSAAKGMYLFYNANQLKWVIYTSVDDTQIGGEYRAMSEQSTGDPWLLVWSSSYYGTAPYLCYTGGSSSGDDVPQGGLLRSAPLDASAAADDLGYALTAASSGVSYASDAALGASCLTCSEYGYVEYSNGIPSLNAFTLSFWSNPTAGAASEWGYVTFSGANGSSSDEWGSSGCEIWIGDHADTGKVSVTDGAGNAAIIEASGVASGWKHIAVVWTGSAFRLYINGVRQNADAASSISFGSKACYLSVNTIHRATGVVAAYGSYAAVRLYNRALSAAQIAALAAEFTPEAE